jgi:uncharacterized protein YbjT (DUF2867 family)
MHSAPSANTPVIAWVAGATGYTGHELVRALCERGATVHAHIRPDSPRLAEWTERLRAYGAHVEAVPWAEEALKAALLRAAPTQVYALLGTTQKRARAAAAAGAPPADYTAVDVGLTLMLLRAAAALPEAPRFVYLSSLGADPDARGAYLRARGQVEQQLRQSTLPYTIARPSFISGSDRPESRPAERISALLADGVLGVLGALGARTLRDRLRSNSAQGLARALIRPRRRSCRRQHHRPGRGPARAGRTPLDLSAPTILISLDRQITIDTGSSVDSGQNNRSLLQAPTMPAQPSPALFEGFARVWTPVALSRQLRATAPLALELAGVGLVLFRDAAPGPRAGR